MSLTSAPSEVTVLDTMVAASATWSALTGKTTWYPAVPQGGSIGAVTPPYILYEPTERNPKAIAPGVFLPNGKINVILYMKTTDAAAIEDTARKIAADLESQQTGLPIIETRVGLASEPDATFGADQDYHDSLSDGIVASTRQIVITVSYGITN